MRKVWTLKERELIKTETKQRGIYVDDDSSSDSDFDNKRIRIPSTKVKPDDEQFGTKHPNAVINHLEGGSTE